VRHSLAQLYISADRLSRLVRQLLSLARNEPGALDAVQLQALDLNAFALEVSMDWVPQALKRDIDLGFEGVEQPLVIDADRDRLRELINNLIDNAIRYSQPSGRVTVQVGPGANVPVPPRHQRRRPQHPGGGAGAHLRALPPPPRHAGGRQRPRPGHRQRDRHAARCAHHAGGRHRRHRQHLQRLLPAARGLNPPVREPAPRRPAVSWLTAGQTSG
jgi:hypothetical protein